MAKRMKDIWFEYYEDAINEGMTEEEASHYAEVETQNYFEQKADYEYDQWKDRQMEDK